MTTRKRQRTSLVKPFSRTRTEEGSAFSECPICGKQARSCGDREGVYAFVAVTQLRLHASGAIGHNQPTSGDPRLQGHRFAARKTT